MRKVIIICIIVLILLIISYFAYVKFAEKKEKFPDIKDKTKALGINNSILSETYLGVPNVKYTFKEEPLTGGQVKVYEKLAVFTNRKNVNIYTADLKENVGTLVSKQFVGALYSNIKNENGDLFSKFSPEKWYAVQFFPSKKMVYVLQKDVVIKKNYITDEMELNSQKG